MQLQEMKDPPPFPHACLFFLLNLFIYLLWLSQVFTAVHRLSLVAVSSRAALQLQFAGFSLWQLLLLQSTESRAHGLQQLQLSILEHRLSSCRTQDQLAHCIWNLLGPEIEPICPVLAGRFLTTGPPGKSCLSFQIIIMKQDFFFPSLTFFFSFLFFKF